MIIMLVVNNNNNSETIFRFDNNKIVHCIFKILDMYYVYLHYLQYMHCL